MGIFESMPVKIAIGLILLSGIGYGSYYGIQTVRVSMATTDAQESLARGFPAVAADNVEGDRYLMLSKVNSCATMIDAYFRARAFGRLEWASQACLNAGHTIVEAFLGLSAVRAAEGRDEDALSILRDAIQTFPKNPVIFVRIAELFRKNKNDNAAIQAYQAAMERAPDDAALGLNTLEYFRALKKPELVKPLATRLKGVKSEQPEVKLVIARALKETGDTAGVDQMIREADALASKNPQLKAALQKAYSDVWKSADGAAAGGAAAAPAAAPAAPAAGAKPAKKGK
ncbi:MAG: tetratricopeptide repeat protein [Bdellovibrionales bacterium]|nr:tetratricopeptide repeat protein [Bdellovibrionales bacterium]